LYDIWVCHWGLAPSEFWRATIHEWWRIYEVKRPKDPQRDYAGKLKQSDVEAMYEELMANE